MPRGVDDRTITPDPMTGALVASLDPAKIQEVAASQLVIIDGYYKGVLQEAQQLFRWALVAAGGGLVFLLAAVSLFVAQQPASISLMSLIGGGMVEGIAVLIFLLYGRAFRELEKFHARLDRTQQYLLANSVCEKLDVPLRQTAQAKLAQAIIDTLAPSEKKPS
jgi:site-specific recombinase